MKTYKEFIREEKKKSLLNDLKTIEKLLKTIEQFSKDRISTPEAFATIDRRLVDEKKAKNFRSRYIDLQNSLSATQTNYKKALIDLKTFIRVL